jgi:hypothetical protein
MADQSRIRSLTNGLGLEIERLIRQLPGADPMLKGDPEPAQAAVRRPSVATAIPATATSAAGASPRHSTAVRSADSTRRAELIGAWLRTAAAAGLGTAVLYWPYAHDCGWLLHTYLGVIAAVLVTGGWASMTAWHMRVAAAHVLGLVVVFWGIVLAAEQILPRIGYAAAPAIWSCVS